MQLFSLLSLVGLLTMALGATGQETTNDLPHPLVPFKYSGPIDGYDIEFNGTVQDIFAHLKKLHPEYELPKDDPNGQGLGARAPASKSNYYCYPVPGQPWERANNNVLIRGVRYLQRMNICDVGGRSCVRISCSYRAAIFLCNDNPHTIYPRCPYIATYALDLMNKCTSNGPFSAQQSCGQEFDTDGYNVITRAAEC